MKITLWIVCGVLGSMPALAATTQDVAVPGRLFYTPAQRAMLNDARLRKLNDQPSLTATTAAPAAPAPVSFDGMITRSDGVATHWVNGRPHVGRSSDTVRNLKPGQTRAEQKVYESYQIRQPEAPRVTPPVSSSTPIKPLKPEDSTP